MERQTSRSASRGRETIRVTHAIMRDPALTPQEKSLWGIYRSYDTLGKGAWPSTALVAYHMGLVPRSVLDIRKSLIQKGYLRQKKRGGRASLYWAVCPDGVIRADERLKVALREQSSARSWARDHPGVEADLFLLAKLAVKYASHPQSNPRADIHAKRIQRYLSEDDKSTWSRSGAVFSRMKLGDLLGIAHDDAALLAYVRAWLQRSGTVIF